MPLKSTINHQANASLHNATMTGAKRERKKDTEKKQRIFHIQRIQTQRATRIVKEFVQCAHDQSSHCSFHLFCV